MVFGFLFVLLVADRQLSLVGNTEAGKRLLGWIFETTPLPPTPYPHSPPPRIVLFKPLNSRLVLSFPYSANPSFARTLFKLCNPFHPGGFYIYGNYFRGHFLGEKTLIVDMYHTFTKSVEKSKKIIDRLIDSFMFKEMLLFSYASSSTLHPRQ